VSIAGNEQLCLRYVKTDGQVSVQVCGNLGQGTVFMGYSLYQVKAQCRVVLFTALRNGRALGRAPFKAHAPSRPAVGSGYCYTIW
jgi:hypothetical protein